MEKSSLPSWLLRALNPNTPMTDDNETMKTIDVEIDGKIYLVPTIRMNDKGELYKLTDKEAVDKAKELGDGLLVPEGRNATEFSKALSDAIPQRKAKGGAIMATRAQRGQATLPMTEATAPPQGGGPKAGNPAALMPPPEVPKIAKINPGEDPRDVALQQVLTQSQKEEAAQDMNTGQTPVTPAPNEPALQVAQGLAAPAPEMNQPVPMKRGGTKEDKDGMSVIIGLGSSPMPAYEEASMGTPKDPPPGATADEVADDQHVLMSEGELVVPANVVRYHGLGTYEGLRREALMGLAEMEKSGQINYDTGIKKAQKGVMPLPQPPTNQPIFGIPPFYGMPPYYGMPPSGFGYTPVTNPTLPIVAPNVGEYKDIINPPADDDDGAPKPPEVVTTPAALIEPPKADPRDDATSPQSMAQARADMDRSYDSAVAQAIAAGFTTPEEIAQYIQEGNVKANTPLGSFGMPGFLFNNVKRPDGTRPIDAAISRYFRDKQPDYKPYTKKEIDSMDQEVGGDVVTPAEPKVVPTSTMEGSAGEQEARDLQLLKTLQEDPDSFPGEEIVKTSPSLPPAPPSKPKPEPKRPTVVKNVLGRDRDEPMGTTIRTGKDAPRGVTITTDDTRTNESGQRGVITSVQAGTKEDKEPAKSCVIATHGVANGGFSPMEKAKAEIWCERTYHGKWYGEAFRRGYRYLASKHVEQDTAAQFYQEFKDFVAFGRGLKKGLKLRLNYYFRTVQFFITGLFVSKDI